MHKKRINRQINPCFSGKNGFKPQYIVFVEVKTRAGGAMVSAVEAVTPNKQRKILLTAQVYLQKSPCALQPRFDVAAVTTLHGEPMGLKYFANAFGC